MLTTLRSQIYGRLSLALSQLRRVGRRLSRGGGTASGADIPPVVCVTPVVCECGKLDPYAVSGKVSMALFEEMLATAAIMGQG